MSKNVKMLKELHHLDGSKTSSLNALKPPAWSYVVWPTTEPTGQVLLRDKLQQECNSKMKNRNK